MPQKTEDAPYDQKAEDIHGGSLVQAEKAYKNNDFLMSRDARNIRILCEFEETLTRLQRCGVYGTYLFFGSARAMYRSDWEKEFAKATIQLKDASPTEKGACENRLDRLKKTEWLCEYMDKCELLAKKLTEYSMTSEMEKMMETCIHQGGTSLRSPDPEYLKEVRSATKHTQRYLVSTGGGPGLMEAANKGASSVKGARTAGFAISLPFEKGLNKYVTPDLAFTFHYFFTRKYWMMYPAKVLIAFPGGFGTFDELFESVTLKQTKKKPPFPVVLIGKEYWKNAINWTMIADKGVISQHDIDNIFMTDDVDEAFEYICDQLNNLKSPMKRPQPDPDTEIKRMKFD